VTVPAGAPASALAPGEDGPVLHTLRTDQVLQAVSILTLLLTTVFGPLQAFLKTTSLDVRQWLICLAVALSIVVVSEVRKAVARRRPVPSQPITR
jgi:hypothetical protein